MNGNILKIAAALCVVALVVCGGMVFGQTTRGVMRYENADRYTAGGTTLDSPVKNLDIHWTDGAVNIAYHDEDTVEIAETSKKDITGDAALRWWLDGDTLRIQYAKSGFFTLRGLNKALTVTLPEDVALGSVGIDATSADVNVPDLRADDARIELTSGDMAFRQTGAADSVKLSTSSGDLRVALDKAKSVTVHSTSGEIEVEQSGAADAVDLSTTSGDIAATLSDAEKLTASVTSGNIRMALGDSKELAVKSTSGKIAVEGKGAQKVDLSSTSGDMNVRFTAFDDLRIDSSSGDITAALPAEPGYRAEIGTASGSFDYTVALTRDGNAYACGDGSASLRINTTSGDIRLEDVNEE